MTEHTPVKLVHHACLRCNAVLIERRDDWLTCLQCGWVDYQGKSNRTVQENPFLDCGTDRDLSWVPLKLLRNEPFWFRPLAVHGG